MNKYTIYNGNKEIECAEWVKFVYEENEETEEIITLVYADFTPKY